jgi:RNA polymerase sigma-70 factor, ECF subfamily
MSTSMAGSRTEDELLAAALAGDEDAFGALLQPHLPALRVHCYRMLGSYHDAEEAMQDVLLRAWRSLGTYQARAPLRHWLYRIATTTSLKVSAARTRLPETLAAIDYLEPYPDRLLDTLPADADPAAAAERRESVSLAFIAALQLLPATQRAALILRDVLAWRGDEVADLLQTSVAAVNSLLQRARATVRDASPDATARHLDSDDRDVLARFVDAWHRRDIAGLAALLHEDVVLRMPPERAEFLGRAAVVEFLATVPAGGRLETIRLVPTRVNGQPALTSFHAEKNQQPYGLIVFTMDTNHITSITGFQALHSDILKHTIAVGA